MRKRYVGIDVGERRLFAAVIETEADSANISFCPETEPTAVLDWCTKSTPQSVAIDAPPAYSKGLAKVGSRRVAEERLGIGGCYGTPQLGALPQSTESPPIARRARGHAHAPSAPPALGPLVNVCSVVPLGPSSQRMAPPTIPVRFRVIACDLLPTCEVSFY
jgi:hypothetical protein